MIRRFYSNLVATPITVTNSAWVKIKDIMNRSNNKYGFLFYASSGGCNGFNYKLELLDKDSHDKLHESKIKPNVLSYSDLNKIYIDPLSEMFLLGTKIDFVKEDYKKNIFESKFIFIPNKDLATSCGCGVSFNPK